MAYDDNGDSPRPDKVGKYLVAGDGAAARTPSVENLFRGYLQHLQDRNKCKSAKRVWGILLGPNGVANAVGPDRLARDIKPKDFIPHLGAIKRRGSHVLAYDTRAWIRAAFEWAMHSVNSYHEASSGIDWGLESNPVASIPTDPDAKRARDRYLSYAEFHAFWHWCLKKERWARYRNCVALRLMMATGQRPGEILTLSADHYDQDQGTLFWKTTKNGKAHMIPLPEGALQIMDGLKPNKHGLYFPRPRYPDQPSTSDHCRPLIKRYVKETGAEYFEVRDLRRTWKTLTGMAGITKEMRDRLQNHAMGDVSEKHYDRWSYLPEKLAAMEQWDRFMTNMINNVPMPVRRRLPKTQPMLMLPAPTGDEHN